MYIYGKIQVHSNQVKDIRHNIMLLWFVKIYERNLKKLQFTTQRFENVSLIDDVITQSRA